MRRFIIDTDTAADDAAALIYMLRNEDISVEAITVVSGNVPLSQAVKNALASVEAADTYAPPVYPGCTLPMLRSLYNAVNVHGSDGMGDAGLKPAQLEAQSGHAVDAICDIIMKNPGEIELLTLGPLTNIALAYLKYPQISGMVKNVVVMGGCGFENGNVTPYAEFNIYADAEAAKVVANSGMKFTLVGCELSEKSCALDAADADFLRDSPDPAANFIYKATNRLRAFDLETYGRDEIYLPDAVAAAVAVGDISPQTVPVKADVEVGDGERYGQVVMDKNPDTPNAFVALEPNGELFKKKFFERVAQTEE